MDVAHAVAAALNETARRLTGDAVLPGDLHFDGYAERSPSGVERHTHAFILPEDLDADGWLDHVAVVQAPAVGGFGFTREGLALLAACPGFWIGQDDARLEPVSLAQHDPIGLDAPSRVWLSLTPFLPPLERGPAAVQLARGLQRMGFPAPTRVEPIADALAPGGRLARASDFAPCGPARRRWLRQGVFERRRGDMAFWRVEFEAPAPGPMSAGGLSHFGLGRFAPGDGA